MEPIIRERAGKILDELPIGETFDWVDKVSIELTTQMLATLFDFPFEERRKLTCWSDVATASPTAERSSMTEDERASRADGVRRLFHQAVERAGERAAEQRPDLDAGARRGHPEHGADGVSRQHHPADRRRQRHHPQHDLRRRCWRSTRTRTSTHKLRANPALIPSMVSEIIRWQTPLAHMRRTALADVELARQDDQGGRQGGDVVRLGQPRREVIENPNAFIIDRERPRQHLSFGFGIHRCVGNRLAEMQLRIIWEEILKRFPVIEVVGEPVRLKSCFLRAYRSMPVRIPEWAKNAFCERIVRSRANHPRRRRQAGLCGHQFPRSAPRREGSGGSLAGLWKAQSSGLVRRRADGRRHSNRDLRPHHLARTTSP